MTDESIFRRSDHLCRRADKVSAPSDWYVYKGKRVVAGPFPKWIQGNQWIEDQVEKYMRR